MRCPKEKMYKRILSQQVIITLLQINILELFLVSKSCLNSCKIIRKQQKIIIDTKETVQILNDHYVNLVERSCSEKPTSIAKQSYLTDFSTITYEDHPSVSHIKKNVKPHKNSTSSLFPISEKEVKKGT